ncbi:MAG TPA: hypothetical protein VGI67_09105 [Thermoleophilaceae bacterium]
MRRGTVAAIAAASAACIFIATQAQGAVHGTRATAVISRNANGPSGGGAFSQDGRRVRYYAFASAASNLAPGDTNGRLDVFVLKRHKGIGALGGELMRASVGSGGQQANGDSSNPSVDGDTHHTPHCVAFQSTATNLSAADPAPDYDIYVRNLRTRRTILASPTQTNATNPTIDGSCGLVAFTSAGVVYLRDLLSGKTYRIGAGDQPVQQADGKGVVLVRGGQIYHRAYQRIHNHGHPKVVMHGGARLVSAGVHGAGNGPSAHPSVSDNGSYVAFESNATNLCTDACKGVSADRNGSVTDVFRRSLHRHGRGMMQMASYSIGVNAQGDGPSNDPVISGAGQFIAFDSAATNLRPSYSIHAIDPNGPARDIYLWNARGHSGAGNVSRESRPGVKGALNGPSIAPSISSHGNYLAFASNEVGQLDGTGQALPNILMRFLGGK